MLYTLPKGPHVQAGQARGVHRPAHGRHRRLRLEGHLDCRFSVRGINLDVCVSRVAFVVRACARALVCVCVYVCVCVCVYVCLHTYLYV